MNVPSEVRELAGSAANHFHSKVVALFRAAGWHTVVSPYYVDGATNRAREVDLIAEKVWRFPGNQGGPPAQLHMKLFVECKYIPAATVFWFDGRDRVAAGGWLVRNTPLPNPTNLYTEKHHYLSGPGKVAKLFETRGGRATDREAVYKALNQVLHSMAFFRRKGSIIPEGNRGHGPRRVVELPVIIVNSFDNLFRVDMDALGEVAGVDANFELEVNYAYVDSSGKNQQEYFLVDVVALPGLDAFFEVLDDDAGAMGSFVGG